MDLGKSISIDGVERRVAGGTGLHSKPTSRLTAVIFTHKACVAKLRERTVGASESEHTARWRLIAYEPRDRREALERLSYLFACVATAHDWIKDDEIEELMTMIRNY